MRSFFTCRLTSRLLLASLALGVAGCGSINYAAQAGDGSFALSAASLSLGTNGQIALHAILPSGDAAPVTWKIISGTNAPTLGQGHVDASGIFTAPGSLSADSVDVRIQAALQSVPQSTAVVTLTVHPGFVQPLLPQNMALTAGATADVTAQIAEVNAGSVKWSLASAATGDEASASASLGMLSSSECQHNAEHYTTCTVTYTAPASIPTQPVYVVAAVNGSTVTSPLRVLLNSQGIVSNPVANQATQAGPALFGASGGNDGDFDTFEDHKGESYVADCCGGTLGALVEDEQNNQYILSNNHVLAESDQGHVGDTIDQPGLIDGACTPLSRPGSTLRPVGTLEYFVPLASTQTNVDAALALATPGAVDASGSILGLGTPGHDQTLSAAPPMAGRGETLTAANLGMNVAKSGRTTGLTCSSIDAVALTVKVDYYKDCAETQPYYTKTFTDQIGIGGTHFTDSGDSGALVLDAGNAQAVGLYFAGGTDGDGNGLSVVNPIGDVLHALSTESGSQLNLVGTNAAHAVACLRYDPSVPTELPYVGPTALARAETLAENAADTLRGNGLLGTAAGHSLDSPGDPAISVYVDRATASVPATISGLRTQVIVTDAGSIARGAATAMPALEPGIHLSTEVLAGATAVERTVAPQLMTDPAIFGVGVTQSRDNPAEPALLVLVDIGRNPHAMPQTIGGLRVVYMRLHRFHTTLSKYATAPHPSACQIQGLTKSAR
ncbi:MAG TPA: hypothetical protein VHZ25_18115 [Acidobacteriaceae bacterium]|jgi:hypothetical protein|nr:hypothetical protein [Acidobacteriaceae bacterium]